MKQFRKSEDGKFICEECDKTYENVHRLSVHIGKKHMSKKEYFDKWLKEENEGKCIMCEKETKFIGLSRGYKKGCTLKCSNEYIVITAKQTKKEKYNDENYNNTEKAKQTCLEKYGVEHPLQSPEIKKKEEQTKKEKYGDEYYNNFEKTKQTNVIKYGVEFVAQSAEVYEKTKQTNKKRYGVEYTFQSVEIREKGKQTRKEKYNDENYNNKEKSKKTCLIKYGVENIFDLPETHEKSKQTKKEKYNDENYRNHKKAKETLIKNYGVEYPLQSTEIFEKGLKTRFLIHQYKNTDLWYQGTYELDFLEKYYERFKGDIFRGPSIPYKYKRKNKMYHSDFYIKSLNLIVEIKSSWTIKQDKEIESKEKAARNTGYNYIKIVDKNYASFNALT